MTKPAAIDSPCNLTMKDEVLIPIYGDVAMLNKLLQRGFMS